MHFFKKDITIQEIKQSSTANMFGPDMCLALLSIKLVRKTDSRTLSSKTTTCFFSQSLWFLACVFMLHLFHLGVGLPPAGDWESCAEGKPSCCSNMCASLLMWPRTDLISQQYSSNTLIYEQLYGKFGFYHICPNTSVSPVSLTWSHFQVTLGLK